MLSFSILIAQTLNVIFKFSIDQLISFLEFEMKTSSLKVYAITQKFPTFY